MEWARVETGGADRGRWVLQQRGFPGVARANKVTPVSLGHSLSVFNTKLYFQGGKQKGEKK